MIPTIKTMVTEHLKKHGYDGLWSDKYDGCGCDLNDLMPCFGMTDGCPYEDCQAGHKMPCPDDCEAGGGCPWHIGPKQEAKNENTG